jgi:hypothetical protein
MFSPLDLWSSAEEEETLASTRMCIKDEVCDLCNFMLFERYF